MIEHRGLAVPKTRCTLLLCSSVEQQQPAWTATFKQSAEEQVQGANRLTFVYSALQGFEPSLHIFRVQIRVFVLFLQM